MLISMTLLEFENFDFLPPVGPNFVPKINFSKILIKLAKMNNCLNTVSDNANDI